MWLRLVYTLAYSGMFGCGCVEHRNDQYQDKENYEDSPSPTRHRAFIINVVGANQQRWWVVAGYSDASRAFVVGSHAAVHRRRWGSAGEGCGVGLKAAFRSYTKIIKPDSEVRLYVFFVRLRYYLVEKVQIW